MSDKVTRMGVIDRLEGEWVVIELDGETEPRNVPRKLLPEGVKDGDYVQLEFQGEHVIQVQLDPEATQAARKRIQDKLDRLRRGEHLQDDD